MVVAYRMSLLCILMLAVVVFFAVIASVLVPILYVLLKCMDAYEYFQEDNYRIKRNLKLVKKKALRRDCTIHEPDKDCSICFETCNK